MSFRRSFHIQMYLVGWLCWNQVLNSVDARSWGDALILRNLPRGGSADQPPPPPPPPSQSRQTVLNTVLPPPPPLPEGSQYAPEGFDNNPNRTSQTPMAGDLSPPPPPPPGQGYWVQPPPPPPPEWNSWQQQQQQQQQPQSSYAMDGTWMMDPSSVLQPPPQDQNYPYYLERDLEESLQRQQELLIHAQNLTEMISMLEQREDLHLRQLDVLTERVLQIENSAAHERNLVVEYQANCSALLQQVNLLEEEVEEWRRRCQELVDKTQQDAKDISMLKKEKRAALLEAEDLAAMIERHRLAEADAREAHSVRSKKKGFFAWLFGWDSGETNGDNEDLDDVYSSARSTLLTALQSERDNVHELETAVASLQQNNSAISEQVISRDLIIDELNDRIAVFEEDKLVLKAALKQLQKDLNVEAPKTQKLVEDLEKAKKEVGRLKKEIKSLIETHREEVQALRETISVKEDSIFQTESNLTVIGTYVDRLEARLAEFAIARRDIELREGKCLEMERSAEESKKERDDLKVRVEELQAEHEEIKKLLQELVNERETLRSKNRELTNEIQALNKQKSHLNESIAKLNSDYGELVNANMQLQREIDNYRANASGSAESSLQLQKEVEASESELHELRRQLDKALSDGQELLMQLQKAEESEEQTQERLADAEALTAELMQNYTRMQEETLVRQNRNLIRAAELSIHLMDLKPRVPLFVYKLVPKLCFPIATAPPASPRIESEIQLINDTKLLPVNESKELDSRSPVMELSTSSGTEVRKINDTEPISANTSNLSQPHARDISPTGSVADQVRPINETNVLLANASKLSQPRVHGIPPSESAAVPALSINDTKLLSANASKPAQPPASGLPATTSTGAQEVRSINDAKLLSANASKPSQPPASGLPSTTSTGAQVRSINDTKILSTNTSKPYEPRTSGLPPTTSAGAQVSPTNDTKLLSANASKPSQPLASGLPPTTKAGAQVSPTNETKQLSANASKPSQPLAPGSLPTTSAGGRPVNETKPSSVNASSSSQPRALGIPVVASSRAAVRPMKETVQANESKSSKPNVSSLPLTRSSPRASLTIKPKSFRTVRKAFAKATGIHGAFTKGYNKRAPKQVPQRPQAPKQVPQRPPPAALRPGQIKTNPATQQKKQPSQPYAPGMQTTTSSGAKVRPINETKPLQLNVSNPSQLLNVSNPSQLRMSGLPSTVGSPRVPFNATSNLQTTVKPVSKPFRSFRKAFARTTGLHGAFTKDYKKRVLTRLQQQPPPAALKPGQARNTLAAQQKDQFLQRQQNVPLGSQPLRVDPQARNSQQEQKIQASVAKGLETKIPELSTPSLPAEEQRPKASTLPSSTARPAAKIPELSTTSLPADEQQPKASTLPSSTARPAVRSVKGGAKATKSRTGSSRTPKSDAIRRESKSLPSAENHAPAGPKPPGS